MAGAPSGRTDKTPYIIYALAAAQAAIGVYYGSNNDTRTLIQAVAQRVTTIETQLVERHDARLLRDADTETRLRVIEGRQRQR